MTATRLLIVDGQPQIVSSQEPLEYADSRTVPFFITRYFEGSQTGRHSTLRFERLLIEISPTTAPHIKTIRTNRLKMTPLGRLHFNQPL